MVSNYRPISVSSNLDSILKNLMHNRLTKFLDDLIKKFLTQNNFDFENSDFSTSHAIISLTENILKCVDDKQIACGVAIDFENAFDIADHTVLLNKLSYYGIRCIEISCLKSYLSNRTQYASINNFSSTNKLIKHDVSQGSVLRPLLF